MAGKTPTERIAELTDRVRDLEAALDKYQSVTDLALKTMQAQLADRAKVEEELRTKVAELTAKNASLEERSRQEEKTSDRGWQLWLAALGFGFGLISLLVTAALQLKK
jgi:outer membrane murein-binding lipoprotein Lpp